MANEKRLIDANAWIEDHCDGCKYKTNGICNPFNDPVCGAVELMHDAPTVDAVEVVHGQRLYNAHEVAVIIADLFGDDCACNFNGIDEWLPFKCELLDACPNPCGAACWEQYLKYRHCKNEMEAKEE